MTGATGRSGPRLGVIVIGVVVLLALAVWGFSALSGDDDIGNTSAAPSTSSSQPAPAPATGEGTNEAPSNAAIRLTAATGPDSRNVRVQGSQFGANEEVVLSVDGTEAKRLKTDASGGFTTALTVPFSRSSFVVRADGATSKRSASGTVTF